MDAIDGLAALEQVVETIGEQLDDLYRQRDIPQIERVTLHSLEWTLAKLADDLHAMETEVRDLRLAVAASRELDLKRLGDMSRIAKDRDELRAQLEQLRAQPTEVRAQVAELSGNSGELPPEPTPEPYQWQVGDEIDNGRGKRRPVTERSEGYVFLDGYTSGRSQPNWESVGWKLHRKAVPRLTPRHVPLDDDLPDIPPMTPQQVAGFAEVTEPISDSTGADGEGQS